MALIGNRSVLSKHPGRDFGGGSIGLGMNRSDFGKASPARARYMGWAGLDRKNGSPSGYKPGESFVIAPKGGGMAAWNTISGSGTVSAANLAAGRNITAALTGSGTISSAALGLIVSAVATLAGTGALTAAIRGRWAMQASLSGSGTLAGQLRGVASILSACAGNSSVSSTLRGTGAMGADITVTGATLTTANVAASVWGALAASFNEAGTMGAKLNAAASAGDPWGTSLPGAYPAGSAGWMLAVLTKFARNKLVTDPVAGTFTLYDDDNTTVLFSGPLYEDAAGTQQYRGQGSERRNRLT